MLLTASNAIPKAPLLLAGIQVCFSIPCRVSLSEHQDTTQTLTTVVCTSQDPIVQTYFAYVCETIVLIVGSQPSLQRVVDGVRHLVNLFQRLARPSSRSVTGLFGELYLLNASTSPRAAVKAWHSNVDERFDFSLGDIRLEVKASSTRQRAHNFSLEQCDPPPGTRGVLVSMFVETSGGGISLLELVEQIKGKLDGELGLILKLQETVADVLGATTAAALPMRFDEQLARHSLQIYEIDAIPAPRDAIPDEVSQVRFRSDISRTPLADVGTLVTLHQHLRLLLPRGL